MTKDQIGGIVRTVAAAILGHFAIGWGLEGAAVETLASAAGLVGILVWSMFTNRASKLNPPA